MGEVLRYEDASPSTRSLCEFVAERLETPKLHGIKPCLAEDWWVEEQMTEGRHFPLKKLSQEEGLRFCWRRARDGNVRFMFQRGFLADPAGLLLHQMTELLPAMFAQADRIASDQGRRLAA